MKTIELEDDELETIIECVGIARDYWNEEAAIAFSEDIEGLALPFAQNRLRKTLDLELKLEKIYENK